MSTPVPALSTPPLFAVPGICASAAAAVLGAPPQAIATRTRQAIIARARQFTIYLHHVALGESLSACARLFARDALLYVTPAPALRTCATIRISISSPCGWRWR